VAAKRPSETAIKENGRLASRRVRLLCLGNDAKVQRSQKFPLIILFPPQLNEFGGLHQRSFQALVCLVETMRANPYGTIVIERVNLEAIRDKFSFQFLSSLQSL
jgi:hypothetical protein